VSLGRYVHTLRYLRPVQFYGRLWSRLVRPRVDARPAPALRDASGPWTPWAWREPSMIAADRFRFLNAEGAVRTAGDWDDAAVPKLWRYNLHYFDDLTARDAAARRELHRALITRWVAEQPAGQGTAWEPYPTSLRIVNWIKTDLDAKASGALLLDQAARQSLAVQLRWLGGRLERHLLGNHLWANAKALLVGGLYFGGAEGDAWCAHGAEILSQELREQFLADGGHFERSPMYHATLLEDSLDLLNVARHYGAAFPGTLRADLAARVSPMLRWLQVMTHPDGRIAFFNDAAFGIAPTYAELERFAAALGVGAGSERLGPLELLPDSGYVRLASGRAVAICDIAPVGPDHLPAHAHADTLAFELLVGAERVVVNGGTSTYAPGAERQRQRGTAAHSTVEVDGEDSSEVWGAFRVARRARARLLGSGVRTGVGASVRVWAEGEHDGYARLPGRVMHRRRWELDDDELLVTDTLTGQPRAARARFHLMPGLRASAGGAGVRVQGAEGPVATITTDPSAPISLQPSSWHPAFGVREASSAVDVQLCGADSRGSGPARGTRTGEISCTTRIRF
jgi:uncharacterized heparinase superfamily protein